MRRKRDLYREFLDLETLAKASEKPADMEALKIHPARTKPDDFVAWYMAQSATKRNEIRTHAVLKWGFEGWYKIDGTIENVRRGAIPPEAIPHVYFIRNLNTLCKQRGSDGDPRPYRARDAFYDYRAKHPDRQYHHIDATVAAHILDISKSGFDKRIDSGKYTPETLGEIRIGPRVVLYDGNAVLLIAMREIVEATEAKASAPTPRPRPSLASYRP